MKYHFLNLFFHIPYLILLTKAATIDRMGCLGWEFARTSGSDVLNSQNSLLILAFLPFISIPVLVHWLRRPPTWFQNHSSPLTTAQNWAMTQIEPWNRCVEKQTPKEWMNRWEAGGWGRDVSIDIQSWDKCQGKGRPKGYLLQVPQTEEKICCWGQGHKGAEERRRPRGQGKRPHNVHTSIFGCRFLTQIVLVM